MLFALPWARFGKTEDSLAAGKAPFTGILVRLQTGTTAGRTVPVDIERFRVTKIRVLFTDYADGLLAISDMARGAGEHCSAGNRLG